MKISFSEMTGKIKEIVISPKTFWKLQKEKDEDLSIVLASYFFPLLLIVVVVVFLGEFLRSAHFYVVFALLKALREFALFTISFFTIVYFSNTLLKSFGGEKSIKRVQQLIAYSFTPFLLVSLVTGLFPFLYAIDVLGLYSLYIFWIGGKELLTLPEQKQDSYLLLTAVVSFLIFSLLSIILSKLLAVYF